LSNIAQKRNVTLGQLQRVNQDVLKDPDTLIPGKKLNVPKRKGFARDSPTGTAPAEAAPTRTAPVDSLPGASAPSKNQKLISPPPQRSSQTQASSGPQSSRGASVSSAASTSTSGTKGMAVATASSGGSKDGGSRSRQPTRSQRQQDVKQSQSQVSEKVNRPGISPTSPTGAQGERSAQGAGEKSSQREPSESSGPPSSKPATFVKEVQKLQIPGTPSSLPTRTSGSTARLTTADRDEIEKLERQKKAVAIVGRPPATAARTPSRGGASGFDSKKIMSSVLSRASSPGPSSSDSGRSEEPGSSPGRKDSQAASAPRQSTGTAQDANLPARSPSVGSSPPKLGWASSYRQSRSTEMAKYGVSNSGARGRGERPPEP